MKLAICTPSYDGRVQLEWAHSTARVMRALRDRGDECVIFDAKRSANLPRLRNGLAAEALGWGADAILWWDADIGVSTPDALAIIDAKAEYVGAAPQERPKSDGQACRLAYKGLEEGVVHATRFDGRPYILSSGVPTAFVKVDRSVYEAVAQAGRAERLKVEVSERAKPWARKWYWYELIGSDEPDVFCEDGEDYYFTRSAMLAGFTPLIDPAVRLCHFANAVEMRACLADFMTFEDQAAE